MLELATMTTEQGDPRRVAAVILAAGGSKRMGTPKQLLPFRGQPLLRSVTESVCSSGVAQVIVVVGASAGRVVRALDGMPVEIVVNESWSQGLSTSVHAGLGAVLPSMRAAVMVLADQPMLTCELLETLVARYKETGALVVAPYHRGRRGNPVVFDRALFRELLETRGDEGGRAVIARHSRDIVRVDVDEPLASLDIDTPEDYNALVDLQHDDKR